MIAVTIISVVAIVMVNSNKTFTMQMNQAQTDSELQLEAQKILTKLRIDIEKAGAGNVNRSSPFDQNIFADLDAANSPWILYFWKDTGNLSNGGLEGDMDKQDQWKRVRLDNDGQLIEEIYNQTGSLVAANTRVGWNDVKQGLASVVLVSSGSYRLPPGIKINALEFNYHKSNQGGTFTGYAASFVRINLILQKNDTKSKINEWINLKNVIYARTT